MAIDYTKVNFQWHVASFFLEPNLTTCLSLVMVLLSMGVRTLMIQEVKTKKMKVLSQGHLSCRRNRRWNGKLRERFQCRLQIKAVIFLSLWSSGNAMGAEQTRQVLARMMQTTEAATQAAQASSAMMERFEGRKKDSSNFGEASKVLKAPDVLEGDDPLKYVSWKEQFTK